MSIVRFSAKGGTVSFDVSSNTDINLGVRCDESWINASTASNSKIEINVEANEGEKARNGDVYPIVNGELCKSKVITISQSSKSVVSEKFIIDSGQRVEVDGSKTRQLIELSGRDVIEYTDGSVETSDAATQESFFVNYSKNETNSETEEIVLVENVEVTLLKSPNNSYNNVISKTYEWNDGMSFDVDGCRTSSSVRISGTCTTLYSDSSTTKTNVTSLVSVVYEKNDSDDVSEYIYNGSSNNAPYTITLRRSACKDSGGDEPTPQECGTATIKYAFTASPITVAACSTSSTVTLRGRKITTYSNPSCQPKEENATSSTTITYDKNYGDMTTFTKTINASNFVSAVTISVTQFGKCNDGGDDPISQKIIAVDLGLSVKWGNMNLGADSPSTCGGYYGWGDITGKLKSRYYRDYAVGNTSTNIAGNTKYDLVASRLGDKWKLPTQAQFDELKQCTWTFTRDYNGSGIGGYIINGKPGSGKEGNSIFMPRCGVQTISGTPQYFNIDADFWTSECTSDNIYAFYVTLVTGPGVQKHSSYMNLQAPMRPIYDENGGSGGDDDEEEIPEPDGSVKIGNAIDLGLDIGPLWADINVGAENPEDYGNYYAWGELLPKGNYTLGTYIYGVQGATDSNNPQSYIDIGGNISNTKYDVARVKWGKGWRMPTEQELNYLYNNCRWEIVNDGYQVIGPNGNSIFLPCCGYFNGSSVFGDYKQARYWLGDVNVYKDAYRAWARALSFVKDSDEHFSGSYVRYIGCAVRPVKDKDLNS